METNKPLLFTMALAAVGTGSALAATPADLTLDQLQKNLSDELALIGTYAQSVRDIYLLQGSVIKNEILAFNGTATQEEIKAVQDKIDLMAFKASQDDAPFKDAYDKAVAALQAVAQKKAAAATALANIKVPTVKTAKTADLGTLDAAFAALPDMSDADAMKELRDDIGKAEAAETAAKAIDYDGLISAMAADDAAAQSAQQDMADELNGKCAELQTAINEAKTTIAGYKGIDASYGTTAAGYQADLEAINDDITGSIAVSLKAFTLDTDKETIETSIATLKGNIATNLANALTAAKDADKNAYEAFKNGLPDPIEPIDGEDDFIKKAQADLNAAIEAAIEAADASNAAMTTINDLDGTLKDAKQAITDAQTALTHAEKNLVAYKDINEKYQPFKDAYDQAVIALSSLQVDPKTVLDVDIYNKYNDLLSKTAKQLVDIKDKNQSNYEAISYEDGLTDGDYQALVSDINKVLSVAKLESLAKDAQDEQKVFEAALTTVNGYKEQVATDKEYADTIANNAMQTELAALKTAADNAINALEEDVNVMPKVIDADKENAVKNAIKAYEDKIAQNSADLNAYKAAKKILADFNINLDEVRKAILIDPEYEDVNQTGYDAIVSDDAQVTSIQAAIDGFDESLEGSMTVPRTSVTVKGQIEGSSIAADIAALKAKVETDMQDYWQWMNVKGDVAAYTEALFLLGATKDSVATIIVPLNPDPIFAADITDINGRLQTIESAIALHVSEGHEAASMMTCVANLKNWNADFIKIIADAKVLVALQASNATAYNVALGKLNGIDLSGLPSVGYDSQKANIENAIANAKSDLENNYYKQKKAAEYQVDAKVTEINQMIEQLIAIVNNDIANDALRDLYNEVLAEKKLATDTLVNNKWQFNVYTSELTKCNDNLKTVDNELTKAYNNIESVSVKSSMTDLMGLIKNHYKQIETDATANFEAYDGMFTTVDADLAQAKADVKGAGLDPKSFYSNKLAELETKLGTLETNFENDYKAGKACSTKNDVAAKVTALDTDIKAVYPAAKKNLDAYNELTEAQQKAKLEFSELFSQVSHTYSTDEGTFNDAEKLYQGQLNSFLGQINEYDPKIQNWYETGVAAENQPSVPSFSEKIAEVGKASTDNKLAYDTQVGTTIPALNTAYSEAENMLQSLIDNALKDNQSELNALMTELKGVKTSRIEVLPAAALVKVNEGKSVEYDLELDAEISSITGKINEILSKANGTYDADVAEYNETVRNNFNAEYNKAKDLYNEIVFEIEKYGAYKHADYSAQILDEQAALFPISEQIRKTYEAGLKDFMTETNGYIDKTQTNKKNIEDIEATLENIRTDFYAATEPVAEAAYLEDVADFKAMISAIVADYATLGIDDAPVNDIANAQEQAYTDAKAGNKLPQNYEALMNKLEENTEKAIKQYNVDLRGKNMASVTELKTEITSIDTKPYAPEVKTELENAINAAVSALDDIVVDINTLWADRSYSVEKYNEIKDAINNVKIEFNDAKKACDQEQQQIEADELNLSRYNELKAIGEGNITSVESLVGEKSSYPEDVVKAVMGDAYYAGGVQSIRENRLPALKNDYTAGKLVDDTVYDNQTDQLATNDRDTFLPALKQALDDKYQQYLNDEASVIVEELYQGALELVEPYNRAEANAVGDEAATEICKTIYADLDALLKKLSGATTAEEKKAIAAEQSDYEDQMISIGERIIAADVEVQAFGTLFALLENLSFTYDDVEKKINDSKYADELNETFKADIENIRGTFKELNSDLLTDHANNNCGKENAQVKQSDVDYLIGLVAALDEAVDEEIESLKAAEEQAAREAANEAAFTALLAEINAAQSALNAVIHDIEYDIAVDVQTQFIGTESEIAAQITEKANALKAEYEAIALTAESTVDLTGIYGKIDQLKDDAIQAQKDFDDANASAYNETQSLFETLTTYLDDVEADILEYNEAVQNEFADALLELDGKIAAEGVAIKNSKTDKTAVADKAKHAEAIKALMEEAKNIANLAEEAQKPYNYTPGDVSGDGQVDINDINSIVDLVYDASSLEPGSAEFNAADINGDNVIDIADVVAAVNLYVYGNISGPKANIRFNDAIADFNDAVVLGYNDGAISFGIDNKRAYVGVQMDIKLEAGMSIDECVLNTRFAGHSIDARQISDNTWRVLVFSMENEVIDTNAGDLFNIVLEGQGNSVSFANIKFVGVTGQLYNVSSTSISINGTTVVDSMSADSDLEYFSTMGTSQNGLKKGVNIIRNADGTTKKVFVK